MLKRWKIFFISVLMLFFLCSCNDADVPKNNETVIHYADCTGLQEQCDSLMRVVQRQDSMLVRMLSLFSEIQFNFSSMKERKEQMFQYVREVDENMLEEIKQNFSAYIKDISLLLTENRQKLEEFKLVIAKREIKIASLESTITAMEDELNMRNQEITSLRQKLQDKDSEISLLENMVATMNEEFKHMGTVIKQQQEQLNTAWYCVADKKTLLNGALISKKGKVLSIDASLVTKIDIQQDREIPIQSKRYELMTAHPSGSYQVIQSGDYVEKLQIIDPQEFWSICKYCVIQVRN